MKMEGNLWLFDFGLGLDTHSFSIITITFLSKKKHS